VSEVEYGSCILGGFVAAAGKVCRDAKNRREGMASQGSYSLDKSDHAKEEGLHRWKSAVKSRDTIVGA
jgi:hypothetical protein